MKRTISMSMTLAAAAVWPLLAIGGELPHAERPRIDGARSMFLEVEQIVKSEHVDPSASDEDGRWSEALHGMLSGLGKNNVLMTPEELAWMRGSVKGSIFGIGVAFEKVQDLVVVKEVLPGAPAARTRIAAKDRILAVDGTPLAERDMQAIVQMIRGPEGTTVELLLQRGTEEWTETITRGSIVVPGVHAFVRDDGVGYLRISHFTERVAADLDAALADFRKRRVEKAVLDLRGCPGGLFDVSTEVAERFLAAGKTIVSTKRRDGTTEAYRAKKNAAFAGRLVVLVDEETSSSAEIVAAALRENGRARVVGEKTFGKGTVEKIFELSGGYGLKLTVARFYSPEGNNWEGQGLEPDFVIPSDYRPDPTYTKDPTQDLSKDVQLKAALNLLGL